MAKLKRDERVCPYCAETIKAAATRCRFCQSDVTPVVEPEPQTEAEPDTTEAEPEPDRPSPSPRSRSPADVRWRRGRPEPQDVRSFVRDDG